MRQLYLLLCQLFIFIFLSHSVVSGNPTDSLYREISASANSDAISEVLVGYILKNETLGYDEISPILNQIIDKIFVGGRTNSFKEGMLLAANKLRNDKHFEPAILIYQKLVFIASRLNDLNFEVQCYWSLANFAWENGRYYLSLENSFRTLIIYEEMVDIDYTKKVALYNLIGLNYRALNYYNEALTFFKRALSAIDLTEDKLMQGVIYTNIGRLYFLKGEYEISREYFYKGIDLESKLEDKLPLGRSYTALAELYFYLNEPDSVSYYIQKAIDLQEEIDDKVGLSRTYSVLGFIRKKELNFNAALEIYRKSIALAESQQTLEELRIAVKGISRVYAVSSDFRNAYNYYLRYSEIQAQQFDISRLGNIKQLEDKIKLDEKEKAINKLMIQRQRSIISIISSFALIAIILTIFLYILSRIKTKSIAALCKQSHTINQQKNELLIMNEELVAAKNKAEAADRLKSVFLSNMSHEIRTPMNSIIGFSNLLSDLNITESDRKMFVEIIQNNSNTLLQLIDDIIDISKIEAEQLTISFREVDIAQLMQEIYLQFGNSLEEKNNEDLILTYEKPPSIKHCRVLADPTRLQQVLVNLLNNAVKFTPSGVIEFGFSIIKEDGESFLKFYVRDTGIGISPEKQNIIFERFRQGDDGTTRSFAGTGLGLSIAHGIVQLMGGRIWLESVINEGSVFYFTIPYNPVLTSIHTYESKREQRMERPLFHGRKILIAEDEPNNYILMEKLLKNSGTNVLWAQTGVETVDIVKANPDIDLVLMDIRLPGMNGLEASRKIRKFNTKLIIIAQTACAMDEDMQLCLMAGCNDYISKPFEISKFYALISKYLGK